MAISINGTTGISGVDGSASTPALQGSDTNTGISFGTDEVAINTNGTQRALVDSSGNINIDSGTLYVDAVNNLVGVGTSSISSGLSVAKYGSQLIPGANVYNIPAGRYHAHLGTAAAGQNLWVGFHGEYNAATGSVNLLLQPTFTDVSQQAGAYIGGEATSAGSTAITFGHLTGGATTSSNATKVERARITSGGEVYIAGTSDQGAYNLQVNGTGVWGAGAYVNGSDERLKEDIQPLADASEVLHKLRPVSFKYKADYSRDQSIQPGFIAQELQEAMAGQVYLDGVVQQGPEYLNVAYQGLIPVLTKALQEAITRIEALEAEVQALKGGN